MLDRHQPREEFVGRLEATIRREVRQRRHELPIVGWMLQSRVRALAIVAGLVVLSMSVGGAVVAAAYQAQTNERRDLLASHYERRLEIARERLRNAHVAVQAVERRFNVGIATNEDMLDARVRLAEAESQARSTQLQLEEVRLTGREPLTEVSAPLVNGRDFVRERWLAEMEAPAAALEAEKARLQSAEMRVSVGVANASDVEAARARILELEGALQGLRRRVEIRQQFLNKQFDAAVADLLVLEAEAEQRRQVLVPQMEMAKRLIARVQSMVDRGLASPVQVAEAALKLRELETDLAKADLDLALIRKQLVGRRR